MRPSHVFLEGTGFKCRNYQVLIARESSEAPLLPCVVQEVFRGALLKAATDESSSRSMKVQKPYAGVINIRYCKWAHLVPLHVVSPDANEFKCSAASGGYAVQPLSNDGVVVYEVSPKHYKVQDDGFFLRVVFTEDALKAYFKLKAGIQMEDITKVEQLVVEAQEHEPSWNPELIWLPSGA